VNSQQYPEGLHDHEQLSDVPTR